MSIDSIDDVAHTAFVSQYLDDDVVRLVVTGTHHIQPGMQVQDRDTAVMAPLTENDVRDVVAASRSSQAGVSAIETGIKVIDLFVPIIDGGTVAIVGDMNVGKMVMVEELFHRLGVGARNITILVFFQLRDEIGSIRKLEYRSNGKQTAIILPVTDASPEALEPALRSVDSVIVFSRELAEQNFYPAVDPSRSRTLDRSGTGSNESVERARSLLGSETADPQLKLLIRNYLAQPFYVAEAFTGLQGQSVSKSTALDELSRILAGEFNNRSVKELFMKGSIS